MLLGSVALAGAMTAAAGLQGDVVPLEAVEPAPSVLGVFLLAVLQGLTEFLPVSSSGHLALGRAVLDLKEGGLALDVALHVGTLFAIVVAFRRDVLKLFQDLLRGDLRMWIWLVVATVPVGVIGVAFKDHIEEAGAGTRGAALGLFATAAALLVGETFRRRNERARAGAAPVEAPPVEAPPVEAPPIDGPPSIVDAVVMGCAQAVAIWPGISRSGSTISAGLVRGKSAAEAARLSFLMSLPAISGAAIVELPHALDEGFGRLSAGTVLAAAAVAGIVGFAALKTLLLVLRKGSFPYFAAYCALLGTAALVLG